MEVLNHCPVYLILHCMVTNGNSNENLEKNKVNKMKIFSNTENTVSSTEKFIIGDQSMTRSKIEK